MAGPSSVSRTLAPGEAHHYTFKFYSREPATVGVSGNRTARLKIENDDGDTLFNDTDSYHNYHWTPRGSVNSKTFYITVRNTHDFPVNYRLRKN